MKHSFREGPRSSPGALTRECVCRNGFFVYMDSLGDNCAAGQMFVQIIFHRPPTPKYGCYAPGGE